MAARRSTAKLLLAFFALAIGTTALVTAAPAGAAAAPLRVLILGDSYSAGNGAGDYYGVADCYRSHSTWGELTARQLADAAGRTVEVTNRACSGGVTTDITGGDARSNTIRARKLETRETFTFAADSKSEANATARTECAKRTSSAADHADEYWSGKAKSLGGSVYRLVCERFVRAQIQSVDDSYDLVLLTTGGNDVNFSGIGTRCLAEVAPFSTWDRDKDTCDDNLRAATRKLTSGTASGVRAQLLRAIEMIDARLNPATRATPGQILLLSYPYLISNDDYAYDGMKIGPRLKRISDLGDAVQREVMGLANRDLGSAGCIRKTAIFGDGTKAEFAGHEPVAPIGLDGDEDWWLWEVTLPGIDGTRPSKESLHPKPEGHRAEARAAVAAATAGGFIPGTCAVSSAFILNRSDNGFEGANLAATLADQGAVVSRGSALPTDLSGFRSVWVVIAYTGLTTVEQQSLAAYVRGGGALYLTGERPCCEALNDSVQALVNSVLRTPTVQVGDLGDIAGTFSVNPNAAGSIGLNPQRLTVFVPKSPGGLAGIGGVTGRNVFISNGTTPVAAVWTESDMTTGKGRIALLMDIDWLGTSSRTQFSVNVYEFLSARA